MRRILYEKAAQRRLFRFCAAWAGYGVQCSRGGVRLQYTVIEFFQSETEEERRRNLERLLQQMRLINGPKDGGTDAPA